MSEIRSQRCIRLPTGTRTIRRIHKNIKQKSKKKILKNYIRTEPYFGVEIDIKIRTIRKKITDQKIGQINKKLSLQAILCLYTNIYGRIFRYLINKFDKLSFGGHKELHIYKSSVWLSCFRFTLVSVLFHRRSYPSLFI